MTETEKNVERVEDLRRIIEQHGRIKVKALSSELERAKQNADDAECARLTEELEKAQKMLNDSRAIAVKHFRDQEVK